MLWKYNGGWVKRSMEYEVAGVTGRGRLRMN